VSARLWSIGHSTLSAEALLALLVAHRIDRVADVRRFPASRRHPQFDREALAQSLQASGIGYLHFPELGGRREPRPDSPNNGWRDAGFRGYADYMADAAFGDGVARLMDYADDGRCAMLCAEKDWRNCHRGLIADCLKLQGTEVAHIVDAAHVELHPFTEPARVRDGRLCYTADAPEQGRLDL
jgi:uncharacterized protein (DUF488 family)